MVGYRRVHEAVRPRRRRRQLCCLQLSDFYDGIGVLVKSGLVYVNLVSVIMCGSVTRLWERFRLAINGIRERYKWPQCREHLELLYNEIKSIVERQYPELKT